MSSDESLTPLEVLNSHLAEVREAMVYAKWGNTLWPARTATDEEFEFHKKTNETKSKYLVYFFGSHDFGWVNSIKKYEKDSAEEKPKTGPNNLKLAYLEATLLWKDLPCTNCFICGGGDHEEEIILCDSCDSEYHMKCLIPPLKRVPNSEWICPRCIVLGERKKKRNNNSKGRRGNNNNNNKKGKKRRRRGDLDIDNNDNNNNEDDDDDEDDEDNDDDEKRSRNNNEMNEDENYIPHERKKRKSTNSTHSKEEPSSKKLKTSQNDEYCYICHNNGFLLFCDYKNCNKSYHPQCVGLINPPEESQFICPVHYCKMCLKMSEEDDIYYHCSNCPSSWCSVECMEKDISTITLHSTKKCTYCATPSPLIQFTLILESCLIRIIQSKVGNIFYLPFPEDKVCSLRNVLKEVRSLSFMNYVTFLEYLRQTLNKMCSNNEDDNNDSDSDNDKTSASISSISFPYLRKAANITFETIKTIVEKELKNNSLLDLNIPDNYDKSADINFRKELTLFPDQEIEYNNNNNNNKSSILLSTKSQREKHCSNIKVVPIEHKLPEFNQPVTNKVQVIQKKLEGAKVQITQIAPPGIPSDLLKSVPLNEDEDKRLVKILSKIPKGECQSYRDYVSLDLPSILSIMDQQNILMRKLVEQNAIIKKSLSKIYNNSGDKYNNNNNDNNNRVRVKRNNYYNSTSYLHSKSHSKSQLQQQQQQEPPPLPPPSQPQQPQQSLQLNSNKENEINETNKRIENEPSQSLQIEPQKQQEHKQLQQEEIQKQDEKILEQESTKMEESSDITEDNIKKEYMSNTFSNSLE